MEGRLLEAHRRAYGVDGAHEVLGVPPLQHQPGKGPGSGADALHVGRVDHGEGNAVTRSVSTMSLPVARTSASL